MRKFLVIAASSTIGKVVVDKLREKGHTVLTTARNDSKIIADEYLDASDFNAVEKVFEKVGHLDGVVNCSGSLLLKPAHLTTKAEYEAMVSSSLTTAFATVRSAGKFMTQGGSVVLFSSAAAMIGTPNHEAIAAVKAGIVGLIKSAAATYASVNLRFNAIAPGLTDTSLTASIISNPLSRQISTSMHPLGRLGTPQDIANAILFLLDPENTWITAQVITIDGGFSSIRPRAKI